MWNTYTSASHFTTTITTAIRTAVKMMAITTTLIPDHHSWTLRDTGIVLWGTRFDTVTILISDESKITDAHWLTIVFPACVITSNTAACTVWTAHFFPTWIDAILEMFVWTALVDTNGTLVFWDTDASISGVVTGVHSFETWNTVTCFNIDTTFSNSVWGTGTATTHDFVLRTAGLTTRGAH